MIEEIRNQRNVEIKKNRINESKETKNQSSTRDGSRAGRTRSDTIKVSETSIEDTRMNEEIIKLIHILEVNEIQGIYRNYNRNENELKLQR